MDRRISPPISRILTIGASSSKSATEDCWPSSNTDTTEDDLERQVVVSSPSTAAGVLLPSAEVTIKTLLYYPYFCRVPETATVSPLVRSIIISNSSSLISLSALELKHEFHPNLSADITKPVQIKHSLRFTKIPRQ